MIKVRCLTNNEVLLSLCLCSSVKTGKQVPPTPSPLSLCLTLVLQQVIEWHDSYSPHLTKYLILISLRQVTCLLPQFQTVSSRAPFKQKLDVCFSS